MGSTTHRAASSWIAFGLLGIVVRCSAGDDDTAGGGADAGPHARDDGGASRGSPESGGGGAAAGRSGSMDEPDGGMRGPGPRVPGLMALRIEPARRTVMDDGVDPGESTRFKAIGTFASGDEDLTDAVAWSLGDPDLGTLDEGRFTSAGIGGESAVHARASGLEAEPRRCTWGALRRQRGPRWAASNARLDYRTTTSGLDVNGRSK